MVTRLYFPSVTPAGGTTIGFASTWDSTASAVRRALNNVKGITGIVAGRTRSYTSASVAAIDSQWVSNRMNSGITFSSTITVKGQIMVRELGATDNVDTLKTGIRIFSSDGATLRRTMKTVASYTTLAEFINNATMRNAKHNDGNTLVGPDYTTVLGDRIVFEHGYQSSGGGTTPQAASKLGENAADLLENNTDTADGAGWIEFSNDITFEVIVAGTSPKMEPMFVTRSW